MRVLAFAALCLPDARLPARRCPSAFACPLSLVARGLRLLCRTLAFRTGSLLAVATIALLRVASPSFV
eukprot:2653566-Alexandrium_andersonii.AAC.1